MPQQNHEYWMHIALEEASKALNVGELPIGGALVANGGLLGKTQTQVQRAGSMVAHGELTALLHANGSLYSAERPLVLYTTLEPCIMCLGAMINCEIDELIYGMRCAPDGGTTLIDPIRSMGLSVPEITTGILEDECLALMRRWSKGPNHPAYGYVQAILEGYSGL